MNEFIVQPNIELTPQQMVMGIMGISANKLIEMIRDNRDGQFDQLFVRRESKEESRLTGGQHHD